MLHGSMQLESGTRLGPYEIVDRVGAGGMGEVYRARDTRLARSVAIKVLPSEFAADVRLRARFEQEARTISTLNHPHICTLHDVGRENGVAYLVMEYCDGQTLAERLERGALSFDHMLQYGIDIADALSRAHRAGIVHRDLKPSNIMITKSGVKLLDFGLAKMRIDAPAAESTAQLISEEGSILGTLQYMSPEMLAGKEADARSDIFALGAVFYEMLTGKPAFSGSSKASVIAAILEHEPQSIRELEPNAPPALEHVINKCLTKAPDDRWESAHDVAEQLRWIRDSRPPSIATRSRVGIIVAILMAGALMGLIAWKSPRTEQTSAVVRLSIPLTQAKVVNGAAEDQLPIVSIDTESLLPAVAMSPDGKRIAYGVISNGVNQIYVRQLDSFETVLLGAGTGPFFSADGRWLVFSKYGLLMKMPVGGGAATTLSPGFDVIAYGATWAPDGAIYYSHAGLWKISASGGPPQKLTEPNWAAGENSHFWPQLLPDGKHILFTIGTEQITSFDDAQIAVLSLETGKWKVVLEGGACARYIAGNLIFGRSGNLYTVPFDLHSLSVTGPRRKIVDDVLTEPSTGAAHFDVSSKGDLIYVPGGVAHGRTAILNVDAAGHTKLLANLDMNISFLKISPNRQKIALGVVAANDHIWLYDVASGSVTRFSLERGEQLHPLWTPDGSHIIYTAVNPTRFLSRKADGAGEPEELLRLSSFGAATSCSYDGKFLAYHQRRSATGFDLWMLSLTGERKPRSLLASHFDECKGFFSPDGNWVVYLADETGKAEAYVRATTPGGGHWQISNGGASLARWSLDGKAVFYRHGDDFFIVPISVINNEVQPGKSRLLFNIPRVADYDVTEEGFLVAQNLMDVHGSQQVNVVLNWEHELSP